MNTEIDVTKEVVSLVKKAESALTSLEALQLSQAACNAANAMATLEALRRANETPPSVRGYSNKEKK